MMPPVPSVWTAKSLLARPDSSSPNLPLALGNRLLDQLHLPSLSRPKSGLFRRTPSRPGKRCLEEEEKGGKLPPSRNRA